MGIGRLFAVSVIAGLLSLQSLALEVPAAWIGDVVRVADGDTIEVQRDGAPIKVRLFGVDAPETDQPFAKESENFVREKCLGKRVNVQPVDMDKYGRVVARVILLNRDDLSEQIIKAGLGWWFTQYAPKETKFKAAQVDATIAGRGLWADPNSIAPWDWRKNGAPKPAAVRDAETRALMEKVIAQPSTPRATGPQYFSAPTAGGVFVTATGTKYHRAGCRSFAQSSIPISLTDATARGYTACSVCKP